MCHNIHVVQAGGRPNANLISSSFKSSFKNFLVKKPQTWARVCENRWLDQCDLKRDQPSGLTEQTPAAPPGWPQHCTSRLPTPTPLKVWATATEDSTQGKFFYFSHKKVFFKNHSPAGWVKTAEKEGVKLTSSHENRKYTHEWNDPRGLPTERQQQTSDFQKGKKTRTRLGEKRGKGREKEKGEGGKGTGMGSVPQGGSCEGQEAPAPWEALHWQGD